MWFGSLICWLAWKPLGEINGSTADPGNLTLAIALLVMAFINIGFTIFQEYSSSKVMETIKSMVPPSALVVRDGETNTISAKELVPGDIVVVTSGNRIPADMRIIEAGGLKVDHSMLTGESDPVALRTKATSPNFFESRNIAFFGTNCLEGNGKGIVIATGNNTVMGSLTKKYGTEMLEDHSETLGAYLPSFLLGLQAPRKSQPTCRKKSSALSSLLQFVVLSRVREL